MKNAKKHIKSKNIFWRAMEWVSFWNNGRGGGDCRSSLFREEILNLNHRTPASLLVTSNADWRSHLSIRDHKEKLLEDQTFPFH